MSFTDEEKRRWHADKSRRERKPTPTFAATPIAVCVHCHQPFGISEGVLTPDVALCDICNGD